MIKEVVDERNKKRIKKRKGRVVGERICKKGGKETVGILERVVCCDDGRGKG